MSTKKNRQKEQCRREYNGKLNEGPWTDSDSAYVRDRFLFDDKKPDTIRREVLRTLYSVEGRIQTAFRGERPFPVCTKKRDKLVYTKNEEHFILRGRKPIKGEPVPWIVIAQQLGRSVSGVESYWNEKLKKKRSRRMPLAAAVVMPPKKTSMRANQKTILVFEGEEHELQNIPEESDDPNKGQVRILIQTVENAIKSGNKIQALTLLDVLRRQLFEGA